MRSSERQQLGAVVVVNGATEPACADGTLFGQGRDPGREGESVTDDRIDPSAEDLGTDSTQTEPDVHRDHSSYCGENYGTDPATDTEPSNGTDEPADDEAVSS